MRPATTFHRGDGATVRISRAVARAGTGLPLVLVALSWGCYRGFDGEPGSAADTDPAADSGADAGAGDDGADDGVPAGVCADAPLGATVLRRLTASEYRNAIHDLFDVAPPPVEMLPGDGRPGDFRTTAGQALTPGTTSKYFDVAAFVADARAQAHPTWFPCDGDDACVDDYLRDEGRRIFRRPPSDDEVARYRAVFSARLADGEAPADAAGTMLQAMLVSPHFLFLAQPVGEPGERVPLDDWQIASRLSFLVWASTPDDALLDAAAAGELASPQARAEQAERMLEDPRAEAAIDAFFMQWLTAEDISNVVKDPVLYPDVVPELLVALEEESRTYFRELFWNRGARLDELFTSPIRVRNGALSAYYGDDLVPADQTELTIVEGDVDERGFGLLSQAGMLMSIGRNADTQIIHRGRFVQNKLMCRGITITMAGTVPPLPDIDPEATTREQVAQHTAAPDCQACHSLLNPPGFALEHFDTTGRWRDDEHGLAIDASAEIVGLDEGGTVDGALELSQAMATSELVRTCAVEQMFEFAIGREPTADDRCVTDDLVTRFVDGGTDLQALLVDIVASEAFAERVAPEE